MFSHAARFALLLSPIALVCAPPVAMAQRGVDGSNVTRVFHTGGGSFEQLENGRWIEFGAEGTLIHSFEQQERTPGRVWLIDRNRGGVRVYIDFKRREIWGKPVFGAERLLYRITDVDADRRSSGWRGRRGGGNGGETVRTDRGPGRDRGPRQDDRGRDDRGPGNGGRGNGVTRNVEVGPIWNQRDAETKCRAEAGRLQAEWTGQWSTTVQGRMSVCEIRFR